MKKASRGRKFAGDLGIYAIGNIGSKLIAFLLLPLYTYFIPDTADYGYYDVCVAIVMGLLPLIGFQLGDSGFRYLTGETDRQRQSAIVSFIVRTLIRNSLVFTAVVAAVSCFFNIRYLWFIAAYAIAQTLYDVTAQIVRGLGHIRTFTSLGIINAFLTAVSGVIAVAMLGWGVPGIFISVIMSKLVSLIICEGRVKVFRILFSVRKVNALIGSKLLQFGLPLVPSAICLWTINYSNIFFTNYYLGLQENGLYAVSAKLSSILAVLTFIFYQTWQQNAIEQYHSPDRSAFFSRIFRIYFYALAGMTILIPFVLRLNYFWLVAPEYRQSADYLYLNTLMVTLSSLTIFFEIGYQCAGQTRRVMPPMFLAALAIIGGNIYFVKEYGVYGALGWCCVVYLVLLIYRIADTRKYLSIAIGGDVILLSAAIGLFGAVYSADPGPLYDSLSVVAAIVFIAFTGRVFFRRRHTAGHC